MNTLAQLKNSDLDYAPLIDELNKMLKDIIILINFVRELMRESCSTKSCRREMLLHQKTECELQLQVETMISPLAGIYSFYKKWTVHR